MELDIPPSPPPVEETLASRRAKRQAILAKYAGIASADVSVSPSPVTGLSSAVQALQPPSAISDEISHNNSPSQDNAFDESSGKQNLLYYDHFAHFVPR